MRTRRAESRYARTHECAHSSRFPLLSRALARNRRHRSGDSRLRLKRSLSQSLETASDMAMQTGAWPIRGIALCRAPFVPPAQQLKREISCTCEGCHRIPIFESYPHPEDAHGIQIRRRSRGNPVLQGYGVLQPTTARSSSLQACLATTNPSNVCRRVRRAAA